MPKQKDIDVLIGKQIMYTRKLFNIKQNALAEMLNISPQQLSKYENGKDRLTASMLQDIAKIFGCDVDYFMPEFTISNKQNKTEKISENGVKFNNNEKSDKILKMFKLFHKLSPKEQDNVLDIIMQTYDKENAHKKKKKNIEPKNNEENIVFSKRKATNKSK